MSLNPESDCELCREDFGTCTCTAYCGAIVCLGLGEKSAVISLDEAREIMRKMKEAREENKPPYTCHERGETRVVWNKRKDGLEESVQFTPGFNCRDRSGNGHGVHGMEVWWLLRGPAGAAQFLLYTDWVPGKLTPGHGLSLDGSVPGKFTRDGEQMYPMGADLGYHSRRPQHEEQKPISDDCSVIGGPCYYDGSTSRAEDLKREFVVKGENVIWQALENEYSNLACADFEAAFDEGDE